MVLLRYEPCQIRNEAALSRVANDCGVAEWRTQQGSLVFWLLSIFMRARHLNSYKNPTTCITTNANKHPAEINGIAG